MEARSLWRVDGIAVPMPEEHLDTCTCEQCEGWQVIVEQVPPEARFDEYE